MKFFKNRRRASGNNGADAAAGWIAAGIQKIQCKWAVSMSRIFARLSPAWAKAVVTGCLLLMAGYSTILIASAFSKLDKMFDKPAIHFKAIPSQRPLDSTPALPDRMIGRIQRFSRYLDSLASSAEGRRVRDSLLKRRPGLLDSIRQIETIYGK